MNTLKDPDLLDRYASDVMNSNQPEYFDGIEINGVRDCQGSIEVDNIKPDAFSVYLHYKPDEEAGRVGVVCVGDFARVEDARGYADELSNRYALPIHDNTTKEELSCDRMLDAFILEAAGFDEMDRAIEYITDLTGISNLDICHKYLPPTQSQMWPMLTLAGRVGALEAWRAAERGARIDYPEPVEEVDPVHQERFALVLAGLLALRRCVGDGETSTVMDKLFEDSGIDAQTTISDMHAKIDSLIGDIKEEKVFLGFSFESYWCAAS